MDRPGLDHDTAEPACDTVETWATTWRGRATIRPACTRGVRQRAHAHGLARGSHDTNLYSRWGAAFWVAIQQAAWLTEGRNTKFCIVAEEGDSRSRYSAARATI